MKASYCILLGIACLINEANAQEDGSNNLNNLGDCNANVQGSGNNVFVNCNPNGGQQPSSALLVITHDQWGVIRFWYHDQFGNAYPFTFHSGVVDFSISTLSVKIDGEEFFGYLNEQFEGGDMRVNVGQYPFIMRASFYFFNGLQQEVSCNGILNIQSSAELVPYFNINVDQFRQQIRKLDCGFIANPV